MHWKRVYVAVIFLPLFYILVQYLPPLAFCILVLFTMWAGQYEFYRFSYPQGQWAPIGFGLFLSSWVWGYFYLQGMFWDRGILASLIIGLLLYRLAVGQKTRSKPGSAAIIVLGVLYVGWLLGHLVLIRGIDGGAGLIFFLFLVTWAGDTGAYYAGKGLGTRKLAPRTSPNKTVEGAIGGLLASTGTAWLAHLWFIPVLSAVESLGLGLLLGVLGQLGDLAESRFKRNAGVKDSSTIIPAHGGILDKVDSLIFTAPSLYYYWVWIKSLGRAITV